MAQRVLEADEMEGLLRDQRVVRVAFHAEGRTYLIPLGYVWLEGALYVVTSSGEKTRMAAIDPAVAFQVDDAPAAGLSGWSSVTGEGRWEAVADPALRRRVRDGLLRKFPELAGWARAEYAEKEGEGSLVLARITPLWMTGRAF